MKAKHLRVDVEIVMEFFIATFQFNNKLSSDIKNVSFLSGSLMNCIINFKLYQKLSGKLKFLLKVFC